MKSVWSGKRIRKFRKDLGWKVEEFAIEIGVAVNTIYRWERSKHEPLPVFQDRLQVLFKNNISISKSS